jgi:hypothetical protein
VHNALSYRSDRQTFQDFPDQEEVCVSIVFKATQDTFMKASPLALWELHDEEKIPVRAGDNIAASLISDTNGYYYVELAEHMPGNWRKLWYLMNGDWEAGTDAPQTDLSNVKARGHLDVFSEATIAGWVYYAGHTDILVTLDFYFDAKLVGTTIADKMRADVKKAGFETDRCGFDFTPPPGAFAQSRSIEVRASNGQAIARRLTSQPA